LDSRLALPQNTVLDGSYRIERVIGCGGFGITYEAEDMRLRTRVALKEYYPADFSDRDADMSVRPKSDQHRTTFAWGLSSFLEEAQILARFRHPSIVRVTRVFEALSTAYMVMDFEKGRPLQVWLENLGRPPTQHELDRFAGPILDALEVMHAEKFLHRDIAPDNIIVREDGTPVLIDFGAARRAVAEMSRALTGIIKSGYSPQEQYATDNRLQGPWTDLYALGATLYRAVSGRVPEEATLRMTDDRMPAAAQASATAYRSSFLAAIDACLNVKPSDRPQSVAQLRSMLLGGAGSRISGVREVDRLQTMPWASIRWWAAAAATLTVMALAYGGSIYSHRLGSGSEAPQQTLDQGGGAVLAAVTPKGLANAKPSAFPSQTKAPQSQLALPRSPAAPDQDPSGRAAVARPLGASDTVVFAVTMSCEKLSWTPGALYQSDAKVAVAAGKVEFSRPIHWPGSTDPAIGTELGKGTVDGEGQMVINGGWTSPRRRYTSHYEGGVTVQGGRLSGIQDWISDGKAYKRNCVLELMRK
jgi:serine/threonine protein kinase